MTIIRDTFIEQAKALFSDSPSTVDAVESVLDAVITSEDATKIFNNHALAEERNGEFVYKEPPNEAPSLWKDRDKSEAETAISFIKRVYSEWLGKGLTTADIRTLDRPLYTAFYNRPKNSEEIDLPTRTEQTSEWVERVGKDTKPSKLPEIIGDSASKRLTNSQEWRDRHNPRKSNDAHEK